MRYHLSFQPPDMRLCSWAGPQCFVPFLVLLAVLPRVTADQDNPKERHYYVAAVEIDWNYLGKDSRGYASNPLDFYFC